jgi:hypothetical protein
MAREGGKPEGVAMGGTSVGRGLKVKMYKGMK